MLFLKEGYIEKPYESVMEISQSPKIQEPFKKLNFQRHAQGGNHWTAWYKTKKAELGWEWNGKGWGGGRGVFPRRILSN